MHELVVRAFPAYAGLTGGPEYSLDWIVDGTSLLVAVRAAELPVYTDAGCPEAAG